MYEAELLLVYAREVKVGQIVINPNGHKVLPYIFYENGRLFETIFFHCLASIQHPQFTKFGISVIRHFFVEFAQICFLPNFRAELF